MKSHTLAYDGRALQVAFTEGPAEAATHAHDVIAATSGVAMAVGQMLEQHAGGRVDFLDELRLATRGLQILASLAVALDLQRAVAEVSA